ncbi:MAG: serine/threonine protein kinase [Pseudomonadota bacterium]|nr:MAG: serine/threonine protein kinase [Pseudomonadota bacterium]
MQQDRWNRIQALFDSALELGAEEREDYLLNECGSDTALLDELRALLAADERRDDLWNQLAPGTTATASTGGGAAQQIGPYQILGKIGAGGMGVIYRALDTRLEREVALKFLPPHLNADPKARERFVAEARAASRLDHPNICVIHDIGETPDAHLYLTMPFYQGETLETRIAHGALPEDEAVEIAAQVAVGLATAHAHQIVHRDIKPANIMLTHDGGVKILDFGVAKMAGVNMTSTGVSIGTVAYMAPEQLRGEHVDARADVWALGATFYEMLAGHRAFGGQRLHEVIEAVLHAGSNPIATLPGDIPIALRAIIHRALEADLEARYPSAEAMLADLTQLSLSDMRSTARPEGATGAATPRDDAPQWSDAVLDELIATVMPQIGPIAPVLVKRLAKNARSLAELHERLADHLPDAHARTAFFQRMHSSATAPDTQTRVAGQQAAPAAGVSSAPQLEGIEAVLKPMMGPIAGTLIRRQSANCADLVQLCQMLADYLPDENDKSAFLEMTAPLCK